MAQQLELSTGVLRSWAQMQMHSHYPCDSRSRLFTLTDFDAKRKSVKRVIAFKMCLTLLINYFFLDNQCGEIKRIFMKERLKQREELAKRLPRLFQVVIQFRLGQPWPQTSGETFVASLRAIKKPSALVLRFSLT